MVENKFRWIIVCWCSILTVWGAYFTYAFVVHERWADVQSHEILIELKEIKKLLHEHER